MTKRASDKTIDPTQRVIVITGGEPLLERELLGQLQAALTDALGNVQRFDFDGESSQLTLADVFDELRGYSLMGGYKLVVVDAADTFISRHREPLERYVEAPVDHATLVLRPGTWPKNTRLHKAIHKRGGVLTAEPLKPAGAASWLKKRATQHYKSKLEPDAATMLVDRVGTDLLALDSELGKLALMVEPGDPVTAALVERSVGKSSEDQAWEVQEAVLRAITDGRESAVGAVRELIDVAGQPPVLVTYFVADLTRKLAIASLMRQQRQPDGLISKQLKLWGERQRTFFQALDRLRERGEDPAVLLDRVLRLDRRTKTGFGEADGGTSKGFVSCWPITPEATFSRRVHSPVGRGIQRCMEAR